MCCQPGFIVPLMELRQSRFRIILKGLRIFGMVSKSVVLALNKQVSLSFGTVKPGTDSSSLAMKVKTASSDVRLFVFTEYVLFSVVTSINYIN